MKILGQAVERSMLACNFCESKGNKPLAAGEEEEFFHTPCAICKGRGYIVEHSSADRLRDCELCKGTGKKFDMNGIFVGDPCPSCVGRGYTAIE